MHNQVGLRSWFPRNIERFLCLRSLTEGIFLALPAGGITIMACSKITKVKNGKENTHIEGLYMTTHITLL